MRTRKSDSRRITDSADVPAYVGSTRRLSVAARIHCEVPRHLPEAKGVSIAVEWITSQVGSLIGAPICTTRLIKIPDLLSSKVKKEVKPGPSK